MNTSITDATSDWYFSNLFFFLHINVINLLVSLPLNTYIIMLILCPGRGGFDPAEVFTLNQALTDILFLVLGCFQCLCSASVDFCFYKPLGFIIGLCMSARPLFLCCVCLERYLAVVHPLSFLRYKPLRYRLVHSALGWMCALAYAFVSMMTFPYVPYIVLGFLCSVILAIDFFCYMSILYKLRHPGPGDREDSEMNSVKKKAFHVVSINLLTFLIQVMPLAITFSVQEKLSSNDFGRVVSIDMLISVITGFVQPLFVLHRAGKLSFITDIWNALSGTSHFTSCCSSGATTSPKSVCL